MYGGAVTAVAFEVAACVVRERHRDREREKGETESVCVRHVRA